MFFARTGANNLTSSVLVGMGETVSTESMVSLDFELHLQAESNSLHSDLTVLVVDFG